MINDEIKNNWKGEGGEDGKRAAVQPESKSARGRYAVCSAGDF